MSNFVRKVLCSSVVVGALACAAPAFAQTAPAGVDFTVGYQALHASDTWLPVGINIDASGPITDALRVVGEFGWARKSESDESFGAGADATFTLIDFGAGLRYNVPSASSVTPYVQAIVGAARASTHVDVIDFSASDTNFMFQPGAGLVYGMGNWGLVGQVDYRRVTGDAGDNEFRFVVGARFNVR